jgi:hypothetical protein
VYQTWKGRIGRTLFGLFPILLRAIAVLSAISRVASSTAAPLRGGTAVLLGVQVCTLVVAAAGRPKKLFAPACAAFLLVEVIRSSGAGLDITGAVSLAAVLALFIFRPQRAGR